MGTWWNQCYAGNVTTHTLTGLSRETTYIILVRAYDDNYTVTDPSNEVSGVPGRGTDSLLDYNGDGRTDAAAFHHPTDQFFTDYAGNMGQYGWGGADCYPLVWDYNGDGITEVSIYHIPTNQWFVKGYPGDNMGQFGWGQEDCIPVPGDYNGDGIMERAFYHTPSNTFFIEEQGGATQIQFGWNGAECIPVAGDYDGDGITDLMIYHIPTNQWLMYGVGKFRAVWLGGAECIPVPGGLRRGRIDGIAVYHYPTNEWFVKGYPGDQSWGSMDGADRRVSRFPGITTGMGQWSEGFIAMPRTGGSSRGRRISCGVGAGRNSCRSRARSTCSTGSGLC